MAKMDAKTLEERIRKRADERVQRRIDQCKLKIGEALMQLFGMGWRPTFKRGNNPPTEDMRKVLGVLAGDDPTKGWPSVLWREEIEDVRDEVMGTMNELQKILLAKEPEAGWARPEEEPEAEDARE